MEGLYKTEVILADNNLRRDGVSSAQITNVRIDFGDFIHYFIRLLFVFELECPFLYACKYALYMFLFLILTVYDIAPVSFLVIYEYLPYFTN